MDDGREEILLAGDTWTVDSIRNPFCSLERVRRHEDKTDHLESGKEDDRSDSAKTEDEVLMREEKSDRSSTNAHSSSVLTDRWTTFFHHKTTTLSN